MSVILSKAINPVQMDDSIIELEHSILNGWIANNFHSYINNNEISHDNSLSILDSQVQDLTNREYQLVNELNHCKQMLDAERTDRIILLKLLEDKDNLIRQLQTQLSQQHAVVPARKSVPVEIKSHSTEPIDDAYLSDDFNKVENEIKLLLSQNKKLKHKANKSIKHRLHNEQQHQHTPIHHDESYLALRQMVDIQEEIESRLSSEVSALRGTVRQQNTLLKEWEPVINQFRDSNNNSTYGANENTRSSKSDHAKKDNRKEYRFAGRDSGGEEKDQQHQQQHSEAFSKERHSNTCYSDNDLSHSPSNNSRINSPTSSNETTSDKQPSSPTQSQSPTQSRHKTLVSPFPSFSPTSSNSTSNNTSLLSPHTRSPVASNFSPSKIRRDLDRLLEEIHSVTSVSPPPRKGSEGSDIDVEVEVLSSSHHNRSEGGHRGGGGDRRYRK